MKINSLRTGSGGTSLCRGQGIGKELAKAEREGLVRQEEKAREYRAETLCLLFLPLFQEGTSDHWYINPLKNEDEGLITGFNKSNLDGMTKDKSLTGRSQSEEGDRTSSQMFYCKEQSSGGMDGYKDQEVL